jgi:hypothetical protein
VKEQQHSDDECGGSTGKCQDEQNPRSGLMYANVSPAEITSTDPIKVSCQSIAITMSFPVAVIELG